jgi:dTDP-4-dehydrorhamnose reductase
VIFAQLNLKTPLESCSVKEFPSSVKRPTYSVLENARAVALGVPALPTWKDALTAFLAAQYPQAV